MNHPSAQSLAAHPPAEIELKLSLPGADARDVAARLAVIPCLADAPATMLRLRNLYFDTPAQDLRRARAALRLRSVREGTARTRWVQTLKTAGSSEGGGLSQRGEWESRVRGPHIDAAALQTTPWAALDVQGEWLPQLALCFETECLRTLRRVTVADGSRIEVALDVGRVHAADGRTEDLIELELELLEGSPDALFALAADIAAQVPVLPSPSSKAERGWRMADGITHAPRRARQPALAARTPLPQAAQAVLGEALGQFTQNLGGIQQSDGAELVHQARVGWRRWLSALWLFKPLRTVHPPPDVVGLRPLLDALGSARDLDAAAQETLPAWSVPFIAGDAERARQWQAMEAAVAAERGTRRDALLAALQAPATGQALIALERWLYALPQAVESLAPELAMQPAGAWVRRRTRRLHDRLKNERARLKSASADELARRQHGVRLLAKRTRYLLEALGTVLPARRTRHRQAKASELQAHIGAARDLAVLAALLEPLGVEREIVGFLRGVAAARQLAE
ncbi:MAG: CHAD domain-containing protein [Acidovorax sp.]